MAFWFFSQFFAKMADLVIQNRCAFEIGSENNTNQK